MTEALERVQADVARPGDIGMGVEIGLGREPRRRIAAFTPAGQVVVPRRIDLVIAEVGIDLAVEFTVHRNEHQAMGAVG